MTTAHVTTNGATPPEGVTTEMVTPPKRDRAEYMRRYRAQRAANNPAQEFKDQINREPELTAEGPQPELELNKSDEQKPTAEEYRERIIPEADAATALLRRHLAALDQARELERQRKAQAAQIDRANQLFNTWKQDGLNDNEAQFLVASGPQLITELTDFAAREATGQGHKSGTAEYADALRKTFHEHLRHLREQAIANAPIPETPTQGTPMHEPPTPPGLLDPIAAPRPERSGRSTIVSAPVSRETPGTRAYDADHDPRRLTLTAQEAEAARISGISPVEYARQKLRYQQAKRDGLVD